MTIILLFIDGIGLGQSDPEINPFIAARMPFIEETIGNHKLTNQTPRFHEETASFRSIDPLLNTDGVPQSASGQAAILTGLNIPAIIGQHYGPKPNQVIRKELSKNNIFKSIQHAGLKASLLNAFPRGYFEAVYINRRIPGSIAYSAIGSGIRLKNTEDLRSGHAISADFTAEGWKTHLSIEDIPTIPPKEAGRRISRISKGCDFAMFEYWLCDFAGHKQDIGQSVSLLQTIDEVVCGIVQEMDKSNDLLILTSDHGNLEDLSTRRHTCNPVPLIMFGNHNLRTAALDEIEDLTGITPFILKSLGVPS